MGTGRGQEQRKKWTKVKSVTQVLIPLILGLLEARGKRKQLQWVQEEDKNEGGNENEEVMREYGCEVKGQCHKKHTMPVRSKGHPQAMPFQNNQQCYTVVCRTVVMHQAGIGGGLEVFVAGEQ